MVKYLRYFIRWHIHWHTDSVRTKAKKSLNSVIFHDFFGEAGNRRKSDITADGLIRESIK